MSRPFSISVTDLAAAQLLSGEDWWQNNRPYRVVAESERIEVLALWHGSRGRPPQL